MKKVITLVLTTILFAAVIVFAHSGGTDRYGGHHNRKTGGYHYHNAGRLHAAGNPYQNHTTCGICSTSKKAKKVETIDPDSKEAVMALQAGLKCMGYKIAKIDGVMGPETEAALSKYIKDRE